MNSYLYPDDTIIVATHNKGKAEEFKTLFRQVGITTKFSENFNIPEPIENGRTFRENSIIKVKSVQGLNLNAIADDSGLCVDILDGKPGIFSARWAKKYGGWYESMKKIYTMSTEKNNTSREFSAKYYCVLTILWRNGIINCFTGEIKGVILWPPRGSKGFGYDPFFKPVNSDITFGEMDKSIKMTIDHRSVAFDKIMQKHFKRN